MKVIRLIALCAASYCAVAAATAYGEIIEQDGAAANQAPPATTANLGGSAETAVRPDASAVDTVQDIIVTAQRRSERSIDVPISVSAVSAAQLEVAGTNNVQTLVKTVPSLNFVPEATYLAPFIRGIGQVISQDAESSVSTYVDGVYQPNASAGVFDLASVTGIEVLKGPQGTLFGRNATGGALLITTADPGQNLTGKLSLSYGNFNEARVAGYINVPIADGLAVNGAVSYRHTGGYIRDVRTNAIVNESDNLVGRFKVAIEPTDNLKIVLTAAHNELDDPTIADSVTTVPGRSLLAGIPGAGPLSINRNEVSSDVDTVVKTNNDEYNVRATLDLGFATLASTTAFKNDKLKSRLDPDNTYLPVSALDFIYATKSLSQEIILSSRKSQEFNWVGGFFYFRNKTNYDSFQLNGAPFITDSKQNYALAGFVDGTYSFGDLTVIAGVRYSSERRKQQNGPGLSVIHVANVRESAWTPRFGLRYALDQQSNIYATFSRGFKSGQYSTIVFAGNGASPEHVDAYEVGYKHSSRSVSITLAGFLQNYRDIQASLQNFGPGGAVSNIFVNAGAAKIYGLEIEGQYRFTPRFDVNFGAGYNHAEYTNFANAPAFIPTANGGSLPTTIDAAGNSMTFTPRITLSGALNYRIPLASKELSFNIAGSYSSKIYYNFENNISRPDLLLVDAKIGLRFSENLSFRLFAQNIFDAEYVNRVTRSQLGDTNTWGTPRTYGIGADFKF